MGMCRADETEASLRCGGSANHLNERAGRAYASRRIAPTMTLWSWR